MPGKVKRHSLGISVFPRFYPLDNKLHRHKEKAPQKPNFAALLGFLPYFVPLLFPKLGNINPRGSQ